MHEHIRKKIRQIAASIQRFGFNNAILTDDNLEIIAGHGRFEAAKILRLATVPTVCLSHLNETDRRGYVLADNELATKAGWDKETLALELQGLLDLRFEVELTGFETAEIDIILDSHNEAAGNVTEPEDHQIEPGVFTVSRPGDIWVLGRHSVLCGDARSPASYASLLGDEKADLVFTDPPYNVPIDGNGCGLGQIQHREFAMASGEMSEAAFIDFLRSALGEAKRVSRDGALHYVFMDWRHLYELFTAGGRSTTRSLTSAFGTKAMQGWARFTDQNMSRYLSLKKVRRRIPIRLNLAGMVAIDPMFGTMPA